MTTSRPNPEKITVLLVDDHPVWREGLRQILTIQPDIEVIGEVAAGDEALRSIAELKPQVVLLDVNIPKINGIQVTSRLKSGKNTPGIIMLTAYDDREQTLHAIRAGASAYCSKDIEPNTLIEIIRQVSIGNYVVDSRTYDEQGIREWVSTGVENMSSPYVDEAGEHFVPLSPREMEILSYVTHGSSNQEIAYSLGISHQTVKNHMTSILRKLDVQDRTQAAVYAIAHGWVRVSDALGDQDNEDDG
jgi:DNA-binding NarL/FixJ family response regulator